MKRKIVITGISSSIIQKLATKTDLSKYELVGISRNPSPIKGVNIIKGNLLEFSDYSTLLEGCHMIIHGAAITHTRKEKDYREMNLNVTKQLVAAAKEYGVNHFAFISSNTASTESGAYGVSKLLAEQHIQKYFDSWTILRISEVYGSTKKEGIEKLIDDVINKSYVLCPADVPSKLCPIHIDDAVNEMHNHIFEEKKENAIHRVNGPEELSYLEIIGLAEKILDKKIKAIQLSKRFMYFIKWVTKYSPISIGIVPDQVDRLYSQKEIQPNPNKGLMKLGEYIKALVEDNENSTSA